ncbi:MAG: AAA family ATPase [Oscillospiraceae bacterium]|nr:AAA family ATPase [Oscillospiraceae bacterium]
MKKHYSRLIEPYLTNLMKDFPAIAIDGLKGVGKTVSTKRIAATAFELDKPNDFDQITNIPDILVSVNSPVLIDEWQRIPSVWDFVRRAVDDGVKPGTFLLTGSISSTDTNIHSGAGRIIRRKMYPLSLAERDIEKPTVLISDLFSAAKPFKASISGKTDIGGRDYIYEIIASGLPDFRHYSSENRKIAFESFFANLLSHDFRLQGIRLRQPETLLRWLRAYAAAVSTDAGYSEILDASTAGEGNKPAAKTTIFYREALENLWLLNELTPWIDGEGFFSGLKLSPKHYLADPALAVYLLNLDEKILSGGYGWPPLAEIFNEKYGSVIGRLFEALIHLCLSTYTAVNNAKLFFAKTYKGDHEVDFVLQKGSRVIACEVKFAPTVNDSDGKHLRWFMHKVGNDCQDAILITTGKIAYRRKDGIAVVPAALLGA